MNAESKPLSQRIHQQLLELNGQAGNRKSLVVEGGQGYVVFSSTQQDRWHVQVAGGRQLPDGFKISPEDYQRLADWGVRQKRGSGNFRGDLSQVLLDQTLGRWAEQAVTALTGIYGAQMNAIEVRTRCEEVEVLDNKGLLDAMEHLARKRDWAARTGVYMKLVKARLVLALAEPVSGSISSSWPLHKASEMAARPVPAIFTSVDFLDEFEPRGLESRVVSGMDLFPILVAKKVPSVLINPGSKPRGELYSNELWTIVEGIKRLSGTH